MERLILYLSIVLNLILASVVGFNWYIQRNEIGYFDFNKNNISCQQVISTDSATNAKVCFVGNSITAYWKEQNSNFFSNNNFINSGVGGQTSSQILLRFQQDVIYLKPTIVVLNTGINDIGEGDGFYRKEFTLQNIQSMIDICIANNIQLIITSVLPATEIVVNRMKKIENINKDLQLLATANSLIYVDYNYKLRNKDGTFNNKFTFDGIHPNKKGYHLMETAILEVLLTRLPSTVILSASIFN